MDEQEYTLEEISYSQKEDCRIMESVFKYWFKNPKELNFFSPTLAYPFNFKKFLQIYNKNTNTLIIKHQDWIIGHISFQTYKEDLSIFFLFIDQDYRKKGVGDVLLNKIEKISKQKFIERISTKIHKKNEDAIKMFKSLNYKIIEDKKSNFLKFEKAI